MSVLQIIACYRRLRNDTSHH